MENEVNNIIQVVTEKKAEDYKYNGGMAKNFCLPRELMVTITLAEYRELVENSADCKAERSKRYDAEQKLKEAKDDLDRAKKELAFCSERLNTIKEAAGC